MKTTLLITSVVAATAMINTSFATMPILCPQTLQVFCQKNTATPAEHCQLASASPKHFDVVITDHAMQAQDQLATLHFQDAQVVDLDTICNYRSNHAITAQLSNIDNDSMQEDSSFMNNAWQQNNSKGTYCGSADSRTEAINCPFKEV